MGQYLKTELTSDQLEFDLADGTARVQQVMLNTEYINENLETSGVRIVSLVDGYVAELTVCVPWKKLLNQSTVIKVNGLQITLTPLADINMTNTQELVSSFIGSIASSMDLARSAIVDEQLATESDSGGIEQFASIIDQIISRIKVIFENTTIRIESYSHESGLCTGIEIQIDKMEFLDEHLEEQTKNSCDTTITEQPGRLYTVTDLNKLLHIQGVRLYTDIWTPLRNNKLVNSQINSSDSEGDAPLDMGVSSLNFHSCYSQLNNRSCSNTSTRLQHSIQPNPILFAQLFSEKHTLQIHVNNNNSGAFPQNENKRIDIRIYLGGPLFIFLTPSQIELLKKFFSLLVPKEKEQQNFNPNKCGGLPMSQEHVNRMMQQFQSDTSGSEQKQKYGGWSGVEQFYDFSDDPTEIQLNQKTTQNDHSHEQSKFRTNSLETEGGVYQRKQYNSEGRLDIFSLTIRAPTMVALITHDDPLSADSVRQHGNGPSQTIQDIATMMAAKAEHFFKTAANLKLAQKGIQEQREMMSNLYSNDCLRLLANDFHAIYSVASESKQILMEIEGHLDDCDFVECLKTEENSTPRVVEIISFSKPYRATSKNGLTFCLKNMTEKENDYTLTIGIEHCRMEFDPSIIDRIDNLIVPNPFFSSHKNPIQSTNFDLDEAAPLDDKLLLEDNHRSKSISIKFNCTNWLLKLRIPIADLSKAQYNNERKRKIYPEFLEFELRHVLFEMPKSLLTDLPAYGTVGLQCESAKGKFIGDPNELECSEEQMTFFYAKATDSERALGNIYGVRLKLVFDKRNKSLSSFTMNNENMSRSFNESIFNPVDKNKIEGPFSTKDTFHFKEESNRNTNEPSQRLIKAGSREELMDFAEECRSLSNILIDISITQLNLALPNRKFFEILYNRIANDLALWEPKSPKYHLNNHTGHKKSREFVECQSAFMAFTDNDGKKSDNNIADESNSETNFFSKDKIGSHQFSIGFHVERCRILLQKRNTYVEDHIFNSQLGVEMLNAEFFLVYGFKGDPNLSYLYATSTNAELLHKNLFGCNTPFHDDVLDYQTFILPKQKDDICLNEQSTDHKFERYNDDNFVISVKMYFNEEKNTKDIFTAFGLRNTHIHFRPFEKLQHFWAIQFADFFAVSDYGVPGYVPPAIIIDLRVHFTNVFLGYDHSSIMPNSPFQLKLEIGSSYISTYFMERMERLKLDCIFEDMNMWMRKKVPQSVKFDTSARFCKTANNYVKILMSDSIHFVTAYSFVIDQAPGPIIDFACTDQNLALWLCTDTVIEFFNILKEISNSDIITNLMTTFKKPQDGTQEKRETHDASENTILSNEKQPENGAANGTMRSNVSFNEEERLIRDMEAAINDMPVACHTNRKKHIEEAIIDDEEFSSQSASENADDPFIMINMIPTNKDSQKRRIGITQIGRFQTHFDTGGDFEFVATHVNISSANQQAFDGAFADSSTILISYKMKISSLTIYLFGGSDFVDSAHTLPQKSYSQYDSKRDNGLLRAIGSEGGRYRDHTVFLEIKFTKLSSVCNIFNESSNFLSSMMIELGDFSIIDHLSVSLINEMIHRLEIEGEPKSSGPFLKFTLNQDKLREAVVKISLAPIRINLDQDTFDFFVDYKNELAQGLNNVFDAAPIPSKSIEDDGDVPVMELPKTLNTEEEEEYMEGHASDFMNENLYPDLSKDAPISFTQLMERDEATNLDELFSEEDVILSDSFIEEKNNSDRVPNVQAEKSREASQDEGHVFKESQPATSNMANKKGLAAKATFIKDFSFSPACRLRIDYEAKSRIRTDQQGLFLAFLIGMTNLKKTELILKEIRTEKGFLGFGRCAQHVVEEWTNDITNKQLKNVVGGVAVINALVQLGQGFKDLVVSPLEEYQRVDGQVARGIHKGTASFGLNAATAALDATQRVVNLVQNIAELTYDILNPNFAYQQNSQQIQHIPGDLREGISLACDTFREGFVGTAQTFQTAAEQERACGGWGVGIIRHITPTAIKPIVIMSKATSHVLGGLKNQLKPDEHKEEMRKWRHNAVTKQDQFRRQSSSSFHQSSSSNGSSCNGTYDISNRKNW